MYVWRQRSILYKIFSFHINFVSARRIQVHVSKNMLYLKGFQILRSIHINYNVLSKFCKTIEIIICAACITCRARLRTFNILAKVSKKVG